MFDQRRQLYLILIRQNTKYYRFFYKAIVLIISVLGAISRTKHKYIKIKHLYSEFNTPLLKVSRRSFSLPSSS